MKPDFMAELVMVEGLGGFVNSHENIELLDMQLNRDGVVMVLNEDSKASFWINDEKLLFTLRNPSGGGQGWSVGDEVTYWTESRRQELLDLMVTSDLLCNPEYCEVVQKVCPK